MTNDSMDTDVATQVRNAFGVSLGGEENTAKNSGRNSYNYKIFIKIVFRRDDVLDPTTIRYRFMGLSDAIVKAANGNSDAVYLATIDGQRIDPQSSPTDPHEFKSQVKWKLSDLGHQSYAGATIMLHSAIRFAELKRKIWGFLQENQMYIKHNHTGASLEEIVRVALIPFVNPDITFRKGFTAELNQKLQTVVNLKNDEFKKRFPCITNDFKFDVVVCRTNERMKFKHQSTSTSILLVESPKSQSLLCRSVLQEALILMSPILDDGTSRYNSVPIVLKNHKKYPKGPAMVFQLLKKHQQFLEDSKSFQMKGIHRITMDLIKSTIMTECPAINAIEPTFMTDDFGKWTVCTTKEKLHEAQEWIDHNLQLLMDTISPEDKPSLPKAVSPQRIISYIEVSDSEFDNLYSLSGCSISDPPPVKNAWGSPPLTATTQQSNSYSTTSASQATLVSALATKITMLESQLASHESQLSEKLSDQTDTLQGVFDDYVKCIDSKSFKQSSLISALSSKVDAQNTTISSITDRFDSFEFNITAQVAPLTNEAAQAGGLAALIQQTVLGCLTQTQNINPIQTQPSSQPQDHPMDDESSHTPRKLFSHITTNDDTSSSKKRSDPPSPFSRNGQPPPLRVRRDLATTNSQLLKKGC